VAFLSSIIEIVMPTVSCGHNRVKKRLEGKQIMLSVRSALFAAILVIWGSSATSAHAGSASEHAAEFQAGLLATMKVAEQLSVADRYKKLEPVIKGSFHLSLMAGLSAGQHWQTATNDQRERLVQGFSRMSIATLATLFDGYSGEIFSVTGERQGPQDITFVDTVLKSPGRDSDVVISYVARKFGNEWRLIDVIVDGGISELKVRISEYRQTLNTGGIEALITLLNKKADDLLS